VKNEKRRSGSDRLTLLLEAAERLTVDLVTQDPVAVRIGSDTPGYARHVADAENFDVLPIKEHDGRIIRFVRRTSLERCESGEEWDGIPLEDIHPDEIVSATAPLLELLDRFSAECPRLFVLGRKHIDGITTVFDLNQPAAHQFGFGLSLIVEAELARAIEEHATFKRADTIDGGPLLDADVDERIGGWINALPRRSYGGAKGRMRSWQKKVAAGDQLRLTNELVFHDKLGLIENLGLARDLAGRCREPYGASAEAFLTYLRDEVKELRNTVAHDGGTLADEWKIWRWMRTTLCIAQDLANLTASRCRR
jgi:hypothetical protein